MFFLLGIWNGLGEIRAHKLRSALTITCVMLGVASLVLIAGFISGLFFSWETWEREFGWNEQVSVYQKRPPDTDPKIRDPGTTLEDAFRPAAALPPRRRYLRAMRRPWKPVLRRQNRRRKRDGRDPRHGGSEPVPR